VCHLTEKITEATVSAKTVVARKVLRCLTVRFPVDLVALQLVVLRPVLTRQHVQWPS